MGENEQSASIIQSILENARKELLETSNRNPLINAPLRRSRARAIELYDELSEEIFRILVADKKGMTFLPIPEPETGEDTPTEQELFLDLPQPEDEDVDGRGVAKRHTDKKLQTKLTSMKLQKKLLSIYYDARTFEEERGVNILYLALGFLKWFEDENSDRERYAPLLLIPVQLERKNARERFKLKYRDEDITTNLSLRAKLQAELALELPEVPDTEDLSPSEYFSKVADAVSSQSRWEVLPDAMMLGFFSFSKLLMYLDLDPAKWPGDKSILDHPIIAAILKDGFKNEPPLCGEDEKIDPLVAPLDMVHVMDADSSQIIAIEEVKKGRNLVIQGPPGTGKSQTIANLIAAMIKENKKVLFVAEKRAALEVVKRRLNNIGLGNLCLELHSHKANKKTVLEDIRNTLELDKPKKPDIEQLCNDLLKARDRLNQHCEMINQRIKPSEQSVYKVIGELVRLGAKGVVPAQFSFEESLTWTKEQLKEKLDLTEEIAGLIKEIGLPCEHVWRGVTVEAVLPTDVSRLTVDIKEVLKAIDFFLQESVSLGKALGEKTPVNLETANEMAKVGKHLSKSPSMDTTSFASDTWSNDRGKIDGIVMAGNSLTNCRKKLSSILLESGWETDVIETRRNLAQYGNSFWCFLHKHYRQAERELRGILKDKPPKPLAERLEILDTLITTQKEKKVLLEKDELGRKAFGSHWKGESSDWLSLTKISDWESACRKLGMPKNFHQTVNKITNRKEASSKADLLTGKSTRLSEILRGLFSRLQLDIPIAFNCQNMEEVCISDVKHRMKEWLSNTELLTKWIHFILRFNETQSKGLKAFSELLFQGEIPASQSIDMFKMAYYEALVRDIAKKHPELLSFDGASHERVLEEFKSLDVSRIELARQEVALAHFMGIPRSSHLGEMGTIRKEMQKKAKHMSLRKLVKNAGLAMQSIKPVFMMSPLSVAQFLEPGTIEFDILLIDEASQVLPVDAFGAIARSKQIVVVGDERQLPPTRFFSKVLDYGEEEDDETNTYSVGNMESILGLCIAMSAPQRMLRWHYRSRHHSLIEVSNKEFYKSRLYIVPSADKNAEEMGVKFNYITNGIYDRGGSATNEPEAKAVAKAIIEHARNSPDLTLGIGTFSVRQRDLIYDEIEFLRRTECDLEGFFNPNAAEPFFVKNLENIQGDERDVIFISVCYGKDSSGFFAMNFGPLSADGGERRLNVLITRARQRCEVFSSIKADDIDLNRAKGMGVATFKTYLKYAETGLTDTGIPTGKHFDSPFEEEVANALHKHGYELDAQVGVAGFYVDIGVKDPDKPGRYLLGIECDGASYHSSRSARDRDRLRQLVLEDKGWTIHRIWSTDWFQRPEEQLRKTLGAIERAKKKVPINNCKPPNIPDDVSTIDRHETEDAGTDNGSCKLSIPYEEAYFLVPKRFQPHQVSVIELMDIVVKIIKTETPIHKDELARRVAYLWGLQRAGSRISRAVDSAISSAVSHNHVEIGGSFYFFRGNTDGITVRNRENVSSGYLKKPEMISPVEIRKAIIEVVKTHFGAKKDDAISEVRGLFGLKATSENLRGLIDNEIEILKKEGNIIVNNGAFYVRFL